MWDVTFNESMAKEEWSDYVIKSRNGTMKIISENDYVFGWVNIFNCSLALPFNLYAGLIILLSPELRNQSHYIIQLFIIGSNLLTIVICGQEIVYHVWPNEQLYNIYASVIDVSDNAFLFNLILSLIDRLVAITNLSYHKKHFTRPLVLVSCLVLNFLFIFGLSNWFQKLIKSIWVSLFISCAVLIIVIYKKKQTNCSPIK